jgi:hypothetical protein
MSNPVRFQDHTAFHVQVLRVTLAGACLYAVLHVLALITPLNTRVAETLVLTASAAALGLAAFPPVRAGLFSAVLLALGVGLLGTLARQALGAPPSSYPWFGIGVYGLAIGVIAGRDLRDYRRYLLPVATALTVALATYVVSAFRTGVNFAGYVPPFLAEPAYGVVYGFLVSVALLVRQISFERDAVTEAYDKVKPALTGEMKDLSDRAVELYGRIQQVLRDRGVQGGPADTLTATVRNLVLKVVHLGPKWNEVEREVGRTSASELLARIEGLDQKIAATSDEVARKQYRMAKEALTSQVRYLQDIARSRERVTARVHNYLATLERLHLAVINHRGADAAKFSDEIQPILDEISNIGQEVDFASEAIREMNEVNEGGSEPDQAAAPQPAAVSAEIELENAAAAVSEAAAEVSPSPASAVAESAAETPAEKKDAKKDEKDPEASLSASAFDN